MTTNEMKYVVPTLVVEKRVGHRPRSSRAWGHQTARRGYGRTVKTVSWQAYLNGAWLFGRNRKRDVVRRLDRHFVEKA